LRDRLGQSQTALADRNKQLRTLQTEYDTLSKAQQQQSIRFATVTESMKAATARADDRLTQINKATQDLAKAEQEQQRLTIALMLRQMITPSSIRMTHRCAPRLIDWAVTIAN